MELVFAVGVVAGPGGWPFVGARLVEPQMMRWLNLLLGQCPEPGVTLQSPPYVPIYNQLAWRSC